ncbi:MAG: phosphoglycerate dehydrogenase [Deltaproteobacteria bacterium]|nr:phosphoglycerate dehydrogenase [Deltaproteobacteria bacterium]MBW2069625.1 phosphoglycerate dehydrogenase [Deltaproteobacteria bacterium]
MTWRVLVSAPYFLPVMEDYRERLAGEGVELIGARVRERLSEEELLGVIGDIDGIICGDDKITERVLAAAPRLKVISKWGTGIDSIDAEAAARRGIPVYRTPNAFSEPVADTVLGYILTFARKLPWLDRDIRNGKWEKPSLLSLGECVLGVVGVGDCGKAVVRRAVSFGMRVLGNDIVELPDEFIAETGLEVVSLEELLATADFVSLNPDLNPTSYHLIGRAELEQMKPGAYLINTSRGPVVDEAALIEALRQRLIAGAALDVFEEEPLPADSPLRSLDNCLLAPHTANSSPRAWKRVHESTVRNLLAGLRQAALA